MDKERKRNRLKGFDYSSDALFFVTSCVHNRVCCFGKIINGIMNPNEYGQIANKQWKWLAKQYPYVILHAFVVMPNHVHGVIEINRDMVVGTGHDPSPGRVIVGTGRDLSPGRVIVGTGRIIVGTGRDLSLTLRREKIKPLPEIMGAYKTTVSKQIHLAGYTDFVWQRSFHDHIIRDEKSFLTISKYITNNPLNWCEDFFGP